MVVSSKNIETWACHFWQKAKCSGGHANDIWLAPEKFNCLRHINDPRSVPR